MKRSANLIIPLLLAMRLLVINAAAAEKLRVDLIPQGMLARNAAPIPVEVRFNWDSTRLLEGRLDLEFHEGERTLGHYRSGDLALTEGEQTFQLLLPPILAPFSDPQVEVEMKFVTTGNAVEIEPSILSLPTAGERSLVVGWCDIGTAEGELSSEFARNLRLEHFEPTPGPSAQRLLTTSIARLTPEDLPAQPLAYTAYDVMVLTASAFKEANERQLHALVQWAKGGGSVCVFVGEGLQTRHLDCLNQLTESESQAPAFQADSTGNLVPAPKDVLYMHSGVGRSVIVPAKNGVDTNTSSTAWRSAATFLWKMRSSQAQAIGASGFWELPAIPSIQDGGPQNGPRFGRLPNGRPFVLRSNPQYRPPISYAVPSTGLGAEIVNRLMPHTVRLIPFSALIGIMVLFVLMIGPVDFIVLGWLRRRRLTWLLFPAMSIAFTIATVLMANHYLGLRDQRRSLMVVDLDRQGTPLRWNRYELVFSARDKQAVTEVRDALWAPLDVMANPYAFYNPNFNPAYSYVRRPSYGADSGGEAGPAFYEGTLPVRYQISQALRQWQPELNRVFSFEPPPVPLFHNWRAIEEAWPNLKNVRARLAEEKLFPSDCWTITSSHAMTFDPGSTGLLSGGILQALCASDTGGMEFLVSQVSPTGGGNFEDVPALGTEPNDAVLAIVTQNGDDLVVYRRFFYGN